MTDPCFMQSTYSVHRKKLLFKCISMLFWATDCKTVRPMLSDRCLSCPVCHVGVLWPNGWMDQDETWYAGRPRPWPHCVGWGSSFPSPKGAQPHPIFDPYLLWPNGCMDEDATWYGGTPWPKGHCVRWVPSSPTEKGGRAPKFSAHVYCGQTASAQATLCYCVTWGPNSPSLKKGHSP